MTLIECLNANNEELKLDDLDQVLKILMQRQEELKLTNKKISELLLFDFLKHLQQTKTEELNKIQYELQMINEDCKQVEDTLDTLKEKGGKDVVLAKSPVKSDDSKTLLADFPATTTPAAAADDATVIDSKDPIALCKKLFYLPI